MRVALSNGTPVEVVRVEGATAGIVVFPDMWGLRPLFDDIAQNLAQATGRSIAVIEPFADGGVPAADEPDALARRGAVLKTISDDRLLGDAVAAADLLEVPSVAVLGFCMGGMYALKSTGTQRFDHAAAFYGMIRTPDAWKSEGDGEPLDALDNRGDTKVMAVIGSEDQWTPADDVAELERRGVTVYRYEGADHGFVHDASRPAHRAEDAADAMAKFYDFLNS